VFPLLVMHEMSHGSRWAPAANAKAATYVHMECTARPQTLPLAT